MTITLALLLVAVLVLIGVIYTARQNVNELMLGYPQGGR